MATYYVEVEEVSIVRRKVEADSVEAAREAAECAEGEEVARQFGEASALTVWEQEGYREVWKA